MAGLIRYAEGDIVNDTQRLTTSTWANNTNALTTATMHTSSVQYVNGTSPSATALGSHFINIYIDNSTSQSEFAVAYGHVAGSGSLEFTQGTGGTGFSPSRNIYNQYRQLVFGDETSTFSFNGYTPDHIFVVNVNRARYKHNLKPASMLLKLKASSQTRTYTDDSITTSGSAVITNAGRQFNIVEGTSAGVMSGTSLNQSSGGNKGSYGLFYPDAGFMIFNPDALDDEHTGTDLQPTTTQNLAANNNHELMYNAIKEGNSFVIDSEEKVSSQYYFTRARNSEFNYTTNPSFVDTNGNVNITSFVDNPTTYITTVGMYNDSGDLVAVAKLSQPVTKDFTKEALIRVKLDY